MSFIIIFSIILSVQVQPLSVKAQVQFRKYAVKKMFMHSTNGGEDEFSFNKNEINSDFIESIPKEVF